MEGLNMTQPSKTIHPITREWCYLVPEKDYMNKLDAIKHGMTLAAKIAKSRRYLGEDVYGYAYVEGSKQAGTDILNARDSLKESDL